MNFGEFLLFEAKMLNKRHCNGRGPTEVWKDEGIVGSGTVLEIHVIVQKV